MKMLAMFAISACLFAADTKPVALFDGKSLKGWTVCNGFAKYRVEGGAIVGTTAEGSPNSFLCTDREYGDFILEFEVKTDPKLNSGVQVRSHRYDKDTTVRTFDGKQVGQHTQKAGRVYGYQVEISNEQSGASGGIYDEARRGWVDNTSSKSACKAAFKDNQWNAYRVVAHGDSIRTYVNGAECADLRDPLDQTGFIALQVHSYKGDGPAEVRWRNIRITDNGRHVWKPIWDGKTFTGWTPRGGGKWTIEDGAMHGVSVPDDPRIGFVVSDASFQDFTTRLRFKILSGNSGYFVRSDPKTLAAYEIEIDAEKRTGGFWETGGRNWVIGPEDNAAVQANEWNELTGSLHGHRIVFHVNGIKTVDLPNDTQGRTEGVMAVQAHGSKRPTDVWFKDIAVLVPESEK